jgi:hypothetical protein
MCNKYNFDHKIETEEITTMGIMSESLKIFNQKEQQQHL